MRLKKFWNNRSKKGKGCLGCFTVFVLLMILGVAFSDPSDTTEDTSSQPEEQQQVAQQDSKDTEEARIADYDVVETEDISVLNIKRVNYRIVVPTTIKREQIRPTVEKIISDIAGEDNDIDEISILVYSSEELASGSYDIAMAEWAPEGDWGSTTADAAENNTRDTHELKLEIRENLESYLEGIHNPASQVKFGLTLGQRKEIFTALVRAEDKAQNEADELYPIDITNEDYRQENVQKNIDKSRELLEKYKAEVIKEFDITEEVLSEISIEGVNKDWPMPPLE